MTARGRGLWEVDLLTDEERRLVVVDWNDTHRRYPVDCVPDLFAAQAARSPASVAVELADDSLTYLQLDRRSNQLARHLVSLGVAPEVRVGLCLERSIDMVVGVLAVAKAGGAYVPLDPEYPDERLRTVVEDARAAVIIARGSHALPDHGDTRVVRLDHDAPAIARQPDEPPAIAIDPASAAYVLYTSGSTGRPKGVVISHAALANHMYWMAEQFPLDHEHAVLMKTQLGFDASAWELWAPLLAGARLVLARPGGQREPAYLVQAIRSHRITILQVVPTLLAALLEEPELAATGLRRVFCGGEALTGELAARFFARMRCELVNLYGPTEATIDATWWKCSAGDERAHPPIGRPIANVQAYVLDDHQSLVAPGEVGELYIAGAGLGRGYLGRPAHTAERFVPDQFGPVPGARMYRTGDLVRQRGDGSLEFLRRSDHQVKLRGFRIELGEIETALSRHPAVGDAAVVVHEGRTGDRRLVGYVTQADWSSPAEPAEAQILDKWRNTFDQNAAVSPAGTDAGFDITGWFSSLTGREIGGDAMREWVDQTAARVLSLRPRRVLEIGCGSGLIIHRVAPHCERYVGSDLSVDTIETTRRGLSARPALDRVELFARAADDFGDLGRGDADVVILNSVIQYFPSAEYLLRVIEQACRVLGPGGTLFLGDVRSLPLLDLFHVAVQLEQAPSTATLDQVARDVARRVAQEPELAVAPGFFAGLVGVIPAIRGYRVLLKRGVHPTEMNRYRYDVLLRVDDGEQPTPTSPPAVDRPWESFAGVDAVAGWLRAAAPAAARITGIPNARLAAERGLRALLNDDTRAGWEMARARAHLADAAPAGIDPEVLWRLADELRLTVELDWGSGHPDGRFDALFHTGEVSCALPAPAAVTSDARRRLLELANVPSAGSPASLSPAELHRWLERTLPEYMVPHVVVVDQLPLTTSGKVDRAQLARRPVAIQHRPTRPLEGTEALIAGFYEQLLGIDQVGPESNFFELGGHSLLATRLVSRIAQDLEVDLTLWNVFDAPTVDQLSRVVEAARGRPLAPPIERVERTGLLPASFAQRRIWLRDQLFPGSQVYAAPMLLRLTGPVDAEAMRRAIDALVQRHEVLRTRLVDELGIPHQKIDPSAPVWRGVHAVADEAGALAFASQAGAEPFSLEHGPVLRAYLLQAGPKQHWLLALAHHVAIDGWSVGVFTRELAELYAAARDTRPPDLPPLRVQYADFAAWQHQRLQGPLERELVDYWREQLEEIVPTAALPTDRPRPATPTFRAGSVALSFDPELADALRALARSEGVTLYMILLAVLGVAVRRRSGRDDIVIGSPIANRNHRDTEDLIGFFVNVLPMRLQIDDRMPFSELLGRVKQVALGAYAHQDLSFERLVEALAVERSVAHHPLFQISLTLQNTPTATIDIAGLDAAFVDDDDARRTEMDLELHVWEAGRQLEARCFYATDVFDAGTVDRLIAELHDIARRIAHAPATSIAQLTELSSTDRHKLLVEWNDTARQLSTASVVEQFADQVGRRPDAPMLVWDGGELSARELASRADTLARHLRALGVARDTMVGLCMEHCPELVVSVIAIAKAGGACLALVPAHPPDRLQFMVDDASAPVVLTRASELDLVAGVAARVVTVDAAWTEIERQADLRPLPPPDADDIAYVIYTSGSTGRPKGVMTPHRALANQVAWRQERFPIGPDDVVLYKTPLSFDPSMWEFWGPLLAGARLAVAPAGAHRDPATLAQAVCDHAVTTLQVVPTLLDALLDEPAIAASRLERVICGGEVVTRELQRRFFERLPRAELVNCYSPTEATIDATFWPCEVDDPNPAAPIGRPIANVRAYVLDDRMQLAGPGVAGELYLGGVGLARGYMARPALTADRFVPDPFSERAGARMYRTGDLVRHRPDGSLDFLGRADHQIKLRGVRIEPGEIESALARLSGVSGAAVLIRPLRDGRKILVAYVITSDPGIDLRGLLKQTLPDSMVPSLFIPLDRLPLLANGKVDRAALEQYELPPVDSLAVDEPPANAMEEVVAGLFSSVLGIPPVGRNADFFQLGGHSLAGTQLISRLRRAFDVPVSLRELYDWPTVAGLTRRVNLALSRSSTGDELPIIAPRSEEQRGQWPVSALQEDAHVYHQAGPRCTFMHSGLSVRLAGPVDATAVRRSLEEIARRHEVLRARFDASAGVLVQTIPAAGEIAFQEFDLRDLPVAHRLAQGSRLFAREWARRFDLRSEPPMRAMLFRIDDTDSVLSCVVHHIAFDGYSATVMFKELVALYADQVAGRAPSLEPLPFQYADYAAWQRRMVDSPIGRAHRDYWSRVIDGARPIQLPVDHGDRAAGPEALGRTSGPSIACDVEVDPGELGALDALAGAARTSRFAVVLSAYMLALWKWADHDDLTVMSSHSQRDLPGADRLIGYFASALLMRIQVRADEPGVALIARMRDVVLDAYAFPHLPLRKELALPFSLFSTNLNYQIAGDAAPVSAGGVAFRPFSWEAPAGATTQQPLCLFVRSGRNELRGALVAHGDLFESSTLRRMTGDLRHALSSLATRPQRPVAELIGG